MNRWPPIMVAVTSLGWALACDDASRPADGGAETDASPDAAMTPDGGPTPDLTVTSCEEVTVEGAAGHQVQGWPGVYGDIAGEDLRFRAPAVARPTFLEVGDTVVLVEPRAVSESELPGLALDCGAFQHGVASGDPHEDSVVLWTRWSGNGETTVTWSLARDSAFDDILASGDVTPTEETDHTVRVVVTSLEPATTYYYRFQDAAGAQSVIGRTRTAPSGATEHVRLGLVSCSSLYSGYFNAYRRLAERGALDAVLHMGDYIYDFVDEDEPVRVPPSGVVEDPGDLAGHRRRHAEYLADPDLRAARAAHPWIMIWDNHDIVRSAPEYGGGVQAFREWNALRAPAAGEAEVRIYRVLRYGDLLDILMMDAYTFDGAEDLPEGGTSVLGAEQFAWLTETLLSSTAGWRIIGTQKVFAEFGPFSGWNDRPEARTRLIAWLDERSVEDNLFVTGDSHFTIFQDVVDDPLSETRPYDPSVGEGAVGAEFLAASVTRGNFDEELGQGASAVIDGARRGFLRDNPHQVDLELTQHGYGIVDVRAERLVTEVWYSPVLEPSRSERFGGGYAVPRGANRFARERLEAPTPASR